MLDDNIPWSEGATEGFYSGFGCDDATSPPSLRGQQTSSSCSSSHFNSCQNGPSAQNPNPVAWNGYASTGCGIMNQAKVSQTSASFYNPSFDEGMPRLEGVNCNNVKINACSHAGQSPCWGSEEKPISMVYPNDINSWMFRKTEGYSI